METKTIHIYKFHELTPLAKKQALKALYDINTYDNSWYEFIFDDSKEIGKILGFDISRIYFSGFCSQGDGASFDAQYCYTPGSYEKLKAYAPKESELHAIASYLEGFQIKYNHKITASIKHSGFYQHSNCTNITLLPDVLPRDFQYISSFFRSFMDWIYKRLNEHYDYLQSEEQIIEAMEANDCLFYGSGKPYYDIQ